MCLSIPGAFGPVKSANAEPTTEARIASENGPTWSASYARQNWAPGVSTVVIVRSQYASSIAIATPLAAHLNVPLLIADGSGSSQDAETYAALDALNPKNALLVGPGWSPKHGIYAGVTQRVSATEIVNGPGVLGLSQQVAKKFASAGNSAVLAEAGGSDIVTAVSAASVLDTPLMLTEGGYTGLADGVVSELNRLGTERVYQVGSVPNAELEPLAKSLTAAKVDLSSVTGETPLQRNSSVSRLLESKNVDSSKVYVGSAGNQSTALNASLAVARDRAFLHLADGPNNLPAHLRDLVAGWGPEGKKIVLVGGAAELSASFETAIKSAVIPRTTKPEFSVSSFSNTTHETTKITLTPQPGASTYAVYDLVGNQIATGSQPSFELPSLSTTFTIQAMDGSTVVAERDVRISEGNESTGQAERIATSAFNGSTTLTWSEAAKQGARPHKVFRTAITRASDGSLQQGDQRLVGITCKAEFTDASPTNSLQNAYSVETVGSPTDNACSSNSTVAEEAERSMTGLNIPTGLPGSTGSSASLRAQNGITARNTADSAGDKPRATPTLGEAALLESREDAEMQGVTGSDGAAAQAANPVLPWSFRYRMFLSDSRVRPVQWNRQVMAGDGRGFSGWDGTHRTQVDTTFYFDANWQATGATFRKDVGQSIEYDCPWTDRYNGCTETGRRVASAAGIQTFYQPRTSAQPYPYARVTHSVGDPFPVKGLSSWWGDVYAPHIKYVAQYNYLSNGFWLSGAFACAPEQEIWGAFLPGHWQPIVVYRPDCPLAVGAVAGPVIPYVFKM